jgi:FAD/FMN-containing dehydrogenase
VPSPVATTLDPSQLRADLSGRVIAPDDAEYDQMRTVVMGGIDRRPAVIVRPANATDVVRVIALARATGLELAVRCGGHSGAGHGTTEGGILLDLRDMKALDIDPDTRTAWAEGGLTAREVTEAAASHGLAIGFGDTGSVGIGGLTLGGGQGFLGRKFGLTIDNLLAAEVVTADGEILQVDAGTHPDLFWALRGGGGNFGVVTRFKYKLHELKGIVGGFLFLPATADVIAGYVAAAEAAPDELSTIANVMPAPPMPFLPEAVHGQLVVMGILAYAGEADAGERAIAPFRALAEPITDMVRPMPYPELFFPDDESYHPLAVSRTMFVNGVDHDLAETIVRALNASDAAMRAVQLRILGGAIARVPIDATAYAHRTKRIMVNVASFYEGPSDFAKRAAWVTDLADTLSQGDPRGYVNFLGDEGADRVRAAYPGDTWDRLRTIKARYDPDNLFRLNQNIPPNGHA